MSRSAPRTQRRVERLERRRIERASPRVRFRALVGRSVLVLVVTSTLAVSSGCMTFDHLLDPKQPLAMYGGTRATYYYLARDTSPFVGSVIRLIDWPATAVMDTLILPIVAPIVISNRPDVETAPAEPDRYEGEETYE